jgi:hypothetical protein
VTTQQGFASLDVLPDILHSLNYQEFVCLIAWQILGEILELACASMIHSTAHLEHGPIASITFVYPSVITTLRMVRRIMGKILQKNVCLRVPLHLSHTIQPEFASIFVLSQLQILQDISGIPGQRRLDFVS